jgi:DNA polymerase-3 subunit beta
MEIIVKKSELVNALARVQGIVEKKNTVPILSCVLLEVEGSHLFVSATDLEISLRSRYEANVSSEGAVTAPAKKLFEIVRELSDGDVRMTAEEGGWVRIEQGRSRFKVMSLPKEDFPTNPQGEEGERIEFEPKMLTEMIDKTGFAMSHDQTRHALNGILWEMTPIGGGEVECRMVGTDGHRLAYIKRLCRGEVAEVKSAIVPRKAIVELKRLISESGEEKIEVFLQDNSMSFRLGENNMLTRLVEGQFPDYQQVIPSEILRKAIVDREAFYRAVRRVSTLSTDRSTPLKFTFKEGGVMISAVNPEVGEATEDLEADFHGEDLEIGLNARYVIDTFSVIDQDKVRIGMNESLSPGLIQPIDDDEYQCVIMPMRL